MDRRFIMDSILLKPSERKKKSLLDLIIGRNCPDPSKVAAELKPTANPLKNPIDPIYIKIRDLNSKPSIGESAEVRPKPAVEVGLSLSF